MPEKIEPVELARGVTAEFVDRSNRYYGDFHRVRIEVTVTLTRSAIDDRPELQARIPVAQDSVSYRTVLEKMAVPTAQLPAVREELIRVFLANSRDYILKPAFVENFLKRQKGQRPPAW